MHTNRRHSLRFTLLALVAVWVTATAAAGLTYLLVSADEGHYRNHDYVNPASCRAVPPRSSLMVLHGFRPLPAGGTALAASQRAPKVVYIWRSGRRCVTQWTLERGG